MDKRNLSKTGGEVSRLGMGLMRLPCDEKGIDRPAAEAMIDRLMEAGVTYYDTAWFYHNHQSEGFAKEALVKRYARDTFTIATKMPLGEAEKQGAQAIFDQQQQNVGVDCIDFYLMHGINGGSIDHMARIGADEVVAKMKRDGRVRRLGFSWHGATDDLPKVLDGFDWDFCMIQLSYYDWIALDGQKLYEAVTSRNLPLIIMEPVRGGGLARCHPDVAKVFESEQAMSALSQSYPDIRGGPCPSAASWALRWCASLPGVDVVLSGMSDMSQVNENIGLFSPVKPLSDAERAVIDKAMVAFKELPLVPCTECNYCDKCPNSIPIPRLFGGKNDVVRFGSSWYLMNYKNWTKPENQITSCTECGVCEEACPQGINIIERLKLLEAELAQG
ncbi:MAG: aldo/keto reductase [Oscillospiraceae bacterium]|nr:aldo/keto reductase [Oscillospiraceae bacterium]